ncbi:predicted protein [Histoplasma capsulatum var. duboisii H88]|uniref:Predicted protein n=1 Tax=Ajellomyces capsulatus (strain H88) TaxID=544711 RepID=F0UN10_AJEC8|nr:predicted protein [Histoplasma capsulatum var. duboisii H88]
MAEQSTSLLDSIGWLRLADKMTELSGSASCCANPTQIALIKAIQTLIQPAAATATQAQEVELLEEGTHTQIAQDIAQLSSLRRRANTLASITKAFSEAAKRNVGHVTPQTNLLDV